jgi:tRNA(Ile)-lysidine synthase TilS/MesJ
MMKSIFIVVLAEIFVVSNSFFLAVNHNRFGVRLYEKIAEAETEDPNFEYHLKNFMKVGLSENRPAYEIAAELRQRYKINPESPGRKAAKVLQASNSELAIELQEMADEMEETHMMFGK